MNKKQYSLTKFVCIIMILLVTTLLINPTTAMAATTSSVALNTASSYMVKGETTNLQVTGTTKKVTWSSSDKKIAAVTSNGVVKGVGYGTTYVRATVNKKAYTCKIIVINPKNIYFDMYENEITVNGTLVTLNFSAFDYSSADIKKMGITYKVSGNSSVTINGNKVSATAAGSFTITAYVHGKKIDTYQMNAVAPEVRQEKYVPVEAVKRNDYTGYTGLCLTALQKVRQIIDDNNLMSTALSDRDKIVAIQTYLNNTARSNPNDTYYDGEITSVIFDGEGSCEAYAATFCFLCECVDIPCYYCGGCANPGDGSYGHAWNKVKIDDKWYYIDPTWCSDLNNLDKYFLSETLWSDHHVEDEGYYQDVVCPGEIPYINDFD